MQARTAQLFVNPAADDPPGDDADAAAAHSTPSATAQHAAALRKLSMACCLGSETSCERDRRGEAAEAKAISSCSRSLTVCHSLVRR